MSFTTYTSKVSLPITYQWKCSKCGSVNTVSTTIRTKGQSTSSGRKISPVSQNMASSMAQSQMNDILGALVGEECCFRQYRELCLREPCKNCSHKEPWMANNLHWLKETVFRLGIITLVIDVLLLGLNSLFLLGGKSRGSAQHRIDIIGEFILLGIAALLVGGFFFYTYISRQYEQKKDFEISKIPKSALPILVINGRPVINLGVLEAIDSERVKKREVSERSRNTPLHPENSIDKDRTGKEQKERNTTMSSAYSAADEIEKFKGLLDKGIITQEEFDAKKKQLLGL